MTPALFRHRSFLPFALLPPFVFVVWLFPAAPPRERPADAWDIAGLTVIALGLFARALVVGHAPARTSGRHVGRFQADTLTTTGLYSIVRHPIYLANLFVLAGLLSAARAPIFLLAGLVAGALVYRSIARAEDRFLSGAFGAPYETWRRRTRAFVPRPRAWRRAAVPFAITRVLRKEAPTWLAASVGFSGLAWIERAIRAGPALAPTLHAGLPVLGIVAWAILRALKYRTRLLHVSGR